MRLRCLVILALTTILSIPGVSEAAGQSWNCQKDYLPPSITTQGVPPKERVCTVPLTSPGSIALVVGWEDVVASSIIQVSITSDAETLMRLTCDVFPLSGCFLEVYDDVEITTFTHDSLPRLAIGPWSRVILTLDLLRSASLQFDSFPRPYAGGAEVTPYCCTASVGLGQSYVAGYRLDF